MKKILAGREFLQLNNEYEVIICHLCSNAAGDQTQNFLNTSIISYMT